MTDIERINALTTNARNTWFVLLAALVFVGITLMNIEHIDFYGVDRATTLPLVNVEVPTRAFFVAAPLLIAAIYSYFHLYLVRLWDALSTAPARIDNRPLGDVISPWLVTDAALHMRARRRKEFWSPTTHRVLESTAMWLNFAIAWAFGLIVIGLLWWLSMPARTFGLTLSAALSLFIMGFTGLTSFLMLRRRMKSAGIRNSGHIFRVAPGLLGLIFLCFPLVLVSYIRTEGEPRWLTTLDPTGRILALAPLNLTGEQLVRRPQGWLPYAEAQKDYFASWCKREAAPCKRDDLDGKQERAFTDEWNVRRSAARGDLQKPNWNEVNAKIKPDLRNAVMPNAFLSGSHLALAQMEGADLFRAQMEGADLSEAHLEGADLLRAQLEGADLSEAHMEGVNLTEAQLEGAYLIRAQMKDADLSGAQMEGANLREAHMEGAILSEAQMKDADLSGAQMEGAYLGLAQMEGANLRLAQMEGADLSGAQMKGAYLGGAQMEGANLSEAQLEGANLSRSHLTGTEDQKSHLRNTNLSASTNNGGALRFVEMTEAIFDRRTDFRNAFLDGSVAMTDALRTKLGDQCQSRLDVVLSDIEFYGRWVGWIQANPDDVFAFLARNALPERWRDVDAIAPDPGCEWKPPLAEVEGATGALDAEQD